MTGQRSPLAPFPCSLTAFSLFLFLIFPGIVISVLRVASPCLRLSLSLSSCFFLHAVYLHVSVRPSVSRFFLNLFVSVEESGFLSVAISLSRVWSCVFLSLCVLVTDFLISLLVYLSLVSLPPLPFPPSVSHYLLALFSP